MLAGNLPGATVQPSPAVTPAATPSMTPPAAPAATTPVGTVQPTPAPGATTGKRLHLQTLHLILR